MMRIINNFCDIRGTFRTNPAGKEPYLTETLKVIKMRTIKIFAAAALVLMTVACNSNKNAGVPKELIPSKGQVDSVAYLLGINMGSMIKGYNLGDLDYALIKKGMNDFIKAKGSPSDTNFVKQFKIDPTNMNVIMNSYIEKRNAYSAALNKVAQDKFFAEVKAKEGVVTTDSGLAYQIKEAGNESEKPGPRDTVYVHYKLSLKDGTVVEEVAETDPSVMLTLDMVIAGWTEGLQLLGEGGKAVLYVPAELGYGERGSNAIEPNSPLVFDIQLDSIKRYVEPVTE